MVDEQAKVNDGAQQRPEVPDTTPEPFSTPGDGRCISPVVAVWDGNEH
jgi:hypothetical protein